MCNSHAEYLNTFTKLNAWKENLIERNNEESFEPAATKTFSILALKSTVCVFLESEIDIFTSVYVHSFPASTYRMSFNANVVNFHKNDQNSELNYE